MKKKNYTQPGLEIIEVVTEGIIAGSPSTTLNDGGEHDMFGGSGSVSSNREFSLQGSSEEDTRELFSN